MSKPNKLHNLCTLGLTSIALHSGIGILSGLYFFLSGIAPLIKERENIKHIAESCLLGGFLISLLVGLITSCTTAVQKYEKTAISKDTTMGKMVASGFLAYVFGPVLGCLIINGNLKPATENNNYKLHFANSLAMTGVIAGFILVLNMIHNKIQENKECCYSFFCNEKEPQEERIAINSQQPDQVGVDIQNYGTIDCQWV